MDNAIMNKFIDNWESNKMSKGHSLGRPMSQINMWIVQKQ